MAVGRGFRIRGSHGPEHRPRRTRSRTQNPDVARQPPARTGPTTYIEFFHSTNPACKTSLERLKEITGKSGTKLRVIVVTKEDPAKIAPLLRPYLSERISVGLNAEKSFTAFGVSYLPFGVLTDAKNRTLWMGNSLQINEKLIEQSTR